MSIHFSEESMKIESLNEMIQVAKYCINFDKMKDKTWKIPGCYGYPAALLLLAVVEGIGAHIEGGGDDSKIHFKILNNKDWFNLNLSEDGIEELRKGFRNKLSHQTILKRSLILAKGNSFDSIMSKNLDVYTLNLTPLLEITEKMVAKLELKIMSRTNSHKLLSI